MSIEGLNFGNFHEDMSRLSLEKSVHKKGRIMGSCYSELSFQIFGIWEILNLQAS